MMGDDDASFELSTVKIPSKTLGWNLDAWKYAPRNAKAGPHPVIVMAHGFSANKKMGLAPYAEAFASNGYACVVFDYRRFGDSDGTPRESVYVSEQLDDYRSVIAWVRQQEELDAQRVVLWGTSFAGGHAVILAAEQRLNLACVIAQCPYVGIAPNPPLKALLKLTAYGIADLFRQAVRRAPLYIPACAEPGKVGGLTTPESYKGLMALAGDKKNYPNRISASSMFEFPFYNPSSKASKIAFPLLLIAPERDELCPLDASLKVASLSDKCTASTTPGGHFDVYPGGTDHENSLKMQLEFLKQHVSVSSLS